MFTAVAVEIVAQANSSYVLRNKAKWSVAICPALSLFRVGHCFPIRVATVGLTISMVSTWFWTTVSTVVFKTFDDSRQTNPLASKVRLTTSHGTNSCFKRQARKSHRNITLASSSILVVQKMKRALYNDMLHFRVSFHHVSPSFSSLRYLDCPLLNLNLGDLHSNNS